MKLEQSFTVTAPIEQVWDTLIDVERVAPCLPGADITGRAPDGSYDGTFSVKLGPTTAAYRGSLRLDSLDADAWTATMSARGTDQRGQGGASASIVSALRQEGADTNVDVVADFVITGRLARLGRSGMIEDISRRLMGDFAGCLQKRLASERESAATHAPMPGAGAGEGPAIDAQADAALASASGAAAEASSAGGPPPAAPDEAPSGGPAAPMPGAQAPAPAQRASAPPPHAQPPAAKPVKGFSLVFSVLWERIRRAFGGRKG